MTGRLGPCGGFGSAFGEWCFFRAYSRERDILYVYLDGGFKYFLFSPLPGEMIQFD